MGDFFGWGMQRFMWELGLMLFRAGVSFEMALIDVYLEICTRISCFASACTQGPLVGDPTDAFLMIEGGKVEGLERYSSRHGGPCDRF